MAHPQTHIQNQNHQKHGLQMAPTHHKQLLERHGNRESGGEDMMDLLGFNPLETIKKMLPLLAVLLAMAMLLWFLAVVALMKYLTGW